MESVLPPFQKCRHLLLSYVHISMSNVETINCSLREINAIHYKSGFIREDHQMRSAYLSIVVGLILTLAVGGCFRKEILTVEISVPQMRSQECAQIVIRALGTLEHEAIHQAEMNVDRAVAIITYDSMRLARKNIEFAIASAGFDANELRASPEARALLPDGCR